MGYTLRKLPGEPIVLFTSDVNFDMANEVALAAEDANKLLDTLTEPIAYINDLSLVHHVGVEAVAVGASETSRGDAPVFHHPLMKQLIFVTTDPLLKMAVQGLASAIYGNLTAQIVETLDEALALARA